jgi:hypothetical protein
VRLGLEPVRVAQQRRPHLLVVGRDGAAIAAQAPGSSARSRAAIASRYAGGAGASPTGGRAVVTRARVVPAGTDGDSGVVLAVRYQRTLSAASCDATG